MNLFTNNHFNQSDIVIQSEAGECGLACLAMLARHHGDKTDLSALRRRYPVSSRGASLKDLITIADQLHFHTRALKSDIASLTELALPAILHWDLNHYVVVSNIKRVSRGKRYTILDPARGIRSIDEATLAKHFTGIALELIPSTTFRPKKQRPQLRLSQLWTRITGLGAGLTRILGLSIVMQFVTLALPFYTQLAIDTALPSGDLDLLNVIALGFVGLILLSSVSSWLRLRLTLSLSNSLSLQTAMNLFRHTIFLPSAWFEKRHLGDIVSRFGSLQPITDLVSRGLVSSLVDGALAVTTLCLMLIYSPLLTALTTAVVLFYIIIKVASFKSMKLANASVLTAQAIENSAFIENVRGISAIKLFCQEGNRQRIWQNKKTDVLDGILRLGRLGGTFDTMNALIVALENILFIYIVIKMVMAGSMTLGMVFAFQGYKQNFVGSILRVIDQSVSYRLLDVHLDRISDLALEERETEDIGTVQPIRGTIELQNISFSYGIGLPLVLKNISMKIEAGKSTVFVGPSGGGKTTLFKILCGLLQPTHGRILIDGIPLQDFGIRRFRARVGVVSQEDTLFSGSLAENIAFFDADYDPEWVRECCRKAEIDEDIMRMPMKYDTMVGGMGSNLSGGQKQRILLARALYKRPDILFLDEGTAHLDVATEARVVAAVKSLDITRIMVAHRPETIKTADTIYHIVDGQSARVSPAVSSVPSPAPTFVSNLRQPGPVAGSPPIK